MPVDAGLRRRRQQKGGSDIPAPGRHEPAEWRPQRGVAMDQACGHCGEGMAFGYVGGLAACYPCYRDAERAGLRVGL